jgi:diguanylate cyclase (GGDEF)-like protein
MRRLRDLDESLRRLAGTGIFVLAICGLGIVGGLDYFTGYEVSLSLLYLGPVALATWYGGRRAGIGIAVLACVIWYIAEIAGRQYSHAAIPVWNALIRLGFFLTTSMLLSALRKSLLTTEHLARTDGLTELYTRRVFEDNLRHDLALAQRRRSPLSLAYVDLDDFKAVNDTRGHAEGDRMLRAVGQVLRDSVRSADTPARIGGDEFALVLPDTDRRGAEQIISKLRDGLRAALEVSSSPLTCSIGVITFVDPAISPEDAVAAADGLMYEVKHRGKGAVAYSVLDSRTTNRFGGPAAPAAEPGNRGTGP